MIKQFKGKYRFLSNFGVSAISYKDEVYPTAEHLYQALKTLDKKERESVRLASTPGRAKKLGRKITKREDWDEIKEKIMLGVVRAKFQQNPPLSNELRNTGDEELNCDPPRHRLQIAAFLLAARVNWTAISQIALCSSRSPAHS